MSKIKPKLPEIHLALVKALEDPSSVVRLSAARVLGEIKPKSPEIHFALVKALEDPDANVRAAVAEALNHLNSD